MVPRMSSSIWLMRKARSLGSLVCSSMKRLKTISPAVGATLAGENGVAGVNWRLGFLREIALAAVAELMGEGRDVGEASFEVQQDVGRGEISAGIVGAAALALVFVYIDPARIEGLFHDIDVVIPKRF